MKTYHPKNLLIAPLAVLLAAANVSNAADLVTIEAESGTLGTDFTTGNSSGTIYITTANNNAGTSPGISGRVASYNVAFPAAGTYDLYGRVRVGTGAANDDSFFYGNGFGIKSVATDGDWILVNSIDVRGFTNPGDLVTTGGSAGTTVWKWINLSHDTGAAGETPIAFTVTAGNLNQTFQIGTREDGLDLDKFAFGTSGTAFAVSNLNSGTLPSPPPAQTNAFAGPDGIAFHRFGPLNSGNNSDGANPAAGLALVNGVLCGTTLNGGTQGAGTTFYMSANGSNFVTVRAFATTSDGSNPAGELTVSGNGFFGTSFSGGSSSSGAVILGQTNGSLSVIRSFPAVSADNATNNGGASPSALIALSGSTLYGTTTAGGSSANGTVFSQTTNGATFSVLHNFSLIDAQTGTNIDGAVPWGGLILSGSTLYGTASAGGSGGNGVVFSVSTGGANFTTLHSFAPLDTISATNADGAIPYGGLVLSNGVLYGTTSAGGEGGSGTIYSIQTDGLGFAVLHHFGATDSVTQTNDDGVSPAAALILSDNVLYGTASAGGSATAGTVYSLNLSGMQFNTLHSFSALASNGTNAYGAFPVAPLVRLGDSLYGTTFSGGPGAAGTVFSIALAVPQAPPAVITNIMLNLNGSVTLYFVGGPNSTNVIQSASSLMPPVPWEAVSTNVADANGAWQFTDNNDTVTHFYRSYAP